MTTIRRPPGRYDEPRALPRPLALALVGVLLLLAAAGAYLAYDRTTGDRIRFTLLGYEVVDDRSVTVRFEVHAGAPVRCAVHALDRDRREIGAAELRVTAGQPITTTITTTARAASAEVVACRRAP